MQEEYCQLLDISRNTYYVHKRENRPIVALLEKYFTKEELEEFLNSGKISRLEHNVVYTDDLDIMKALEVDNAVYSAKAKLQNLESKFKDWIYNKGSIEILKDVLASIAPSELTKENAKDILFARIKGYDANWISLKNPMKQRLLSTYIEKYFSKLECYAICKYSDEVFDYVGYF
jgi:hypothetical protein